MRRYLVVVMRTAAFDAALVQPHRDFLARLRVAGMLEFAGPFTDGSGGAYLMQAPDLARARALAHEDPLYVSGASTVTVHEWDAT